jgi:Holliday junction resolvase RusA-like endonuclease
VRLTLQSIPTSTNQLERMHWAVKKRLRSQLQWELTAALADVGRKLPPLLYGKAAPKRRVTITAYRPRRLDQDNATGGCKVLLDAMRDIGLIRNDSPKWLELVVNQAIEKRDCRTEILIEDKKEKT